MLFRERMKNRILKFKCTRWKAPGLEGLFREGGRSVVIIIGSWLIYWK
jgi:hypothetical protein